MAQWMGRIGFDLERLAQYVLHTTKQGERVFADDPTADIGTGFEQGDDRLALGLRPGDYRPFGGSGPSMVAYRFEDSRSGGCVARHPNGYHGILQVDGYAAYGRLGKDSVANDAVTLPDAGHTHDASSSTCMPAMVRPSPTSWSRLRPLWAIEEDIRGW